MSKLTEHTLIPIGVAILAIGGVATWMTTVQLSTNANASQIESILNREDAHRENISMIRTDVAIIKNEMRRITAKCELRVKGPRKEPTLDEP